MSSISLPISSYELRSRPASPQRLINCFIEALPPGAKTPAILTRAPGIDAWTTVGVGGIQAMHVAQGLGLLFVVSGSKLYSVDANKTATLLGDVGSPVDIDIDSNTDSVVVVNTPNAYYWDGTTFGQITDPDFTARGAGDVEFDDNYLLFREPNSGRFFSADLASATSFDALNFATAEASPDNTVGLKVDHRQAIQFGSASIEIWENTGASGFPFERALNGFVEQGCLNGRTIVKVDQSVFWLADDFTIRRLDGVTPVRVSTHAIEQRIFDGTPSTASAFTYAQDGHVFYVLRMSEGTFVYDCTTQQWHERQTYGSDTWTVGSAVQFADLILVGDINSNAIGAINPASYAEFGTTQRMEWTYQPIYAEGHRAFHDRVEMVFEPGVGLTLGQGSDPEIMLDKSEDGGITWQSLPNKKLGQIGHYLNRAVWRALGSSRMRVYRGAVSDPVKAVLSDTLVEVRGGRL
jgi:hypothetical protein